MDPLVYGHNAEEKLVAVQQVGDSHMRLYARTEAGIQSNDVEFFPFFFIADPSYLTGFSPHHWLKELDGPNYYRHLCAFSRWSEMWDAVNHIIGRYKENTSQSVESYADLSIIHLRPDAVSQFLIQSGRTLFKTMEFDHLHRMQIDIETYTKHGFRFSNPNRLEDRIIVISLSDNRGLEHIISGKQKSEKEMLEELIAVICEKNPDVIEGHNIYKFDLPYILKRCELHGIAFTVGRDGSPPRSYETRSTITERVSDTTSYEIAGRHIIDTLLLIQAYDSSRRILESYGLKHLAQHFGFATPDRIYIKGDRISWYWDNEPDLLMRYALDDARETKQLSEILSPSYFYLTQMVPMSYGAVVRTGAAIKIESLILREYIRQRHSIPAPETKTPTTGGYTDIFYTGILEPIIHVDIESLYPSIMLTEKIAPKTDTLQIFLLLLEHLTAMRLSAKNKMKGAVDKTEKNTFDAIQSSFKILINSFYGYLGYSRGLFNDAEAADKVTQTGQKILNQLIGLLLQHKGVVIEVDTDGVYFVPPPYITDEEKENNFVGSIAATLPNGINLTIDGRYKKMLSYKKKNYALLSYDQKIIIKGSSLISRNIEQFGRYFIRNCLDALLNHNLEAIHQLYTNLHKDISEHKLNVVDFARTDTLKDSLQKYSREVAAGQRNRTASYELALASTRSWKSGDRISYYITGSDTHVKGFENAKLMQEWDPNFPDENVPYYLKRLDEFAKKFETFFEERDVHAIFSNDDLFKFSARGIPILTLPVRHEIADVTEEESEPSQIDPKIWLDEG